MENPGYDGNEDIPLPEREGDEGESTPFTPMQSEGEPSSSTPSQEKPGDKVIPLSNELKRQKIYALHQELGVTGNVNLAELDRFQLNLNKKSGYSELKFLNHKDEWVLLTNKRTGEFLAESSIRQKMGGVNVMNNMLGVDATPSKLERSRAAARKLANIIPTDLQMDNISLQDLSKTLTTVEHEVKEASQNTDLDMREMLGLDKALQRVQGELANNLGKLTLINEHVEREEQKLKDIKNDPSYTNEQKLEIEKRLERLKDEHSTRLELASQNKRELQGQYARIQQTSEKVLDSDTSLKERIKTLFREQGLTLTAILTSIGMTISTIILSIKIALGIGGGAGAGKPPSSDPNTIKNWVKNKLKALARLLGKLAGTALATLPSIIGSIVSWVLNMLKKVVGFAVEYTYAFITLLCGIIGYWIVEELGKKKALSTLPSFHITYYDMKLILKKISK